MEVRLWFFLAMILAAAAVLLGLASWALTSNGGRAKKVRGPNVAVRQAFLPDSSAGSSPTIAFPALKSTCAWSALLAAPRL
jgi:hypothetical protein